MIFMQNNNKKQFFFYIESNQIMILSVLEKKTEDAFHFTSAKTGSGFLPAKSI